MWIMHLVYFVSGNFDIIISRSYLDLNINGYFSVLNPMFTLITKGISPSVMAG